MRFAYVFYTVCSDNDPLHVIWNRNDFQLSRMPIGFRLQFFHDAHEFFVVPWNKRAAPI